MSLKYACPFCRIETEPKVDLLFCPKCLREYPLRDNVADFSTHEHYWNQLSEEQMKVLLEVSAEHGYRYGIEKLVKPFIDDYLAGYILDNNRADFRAVLPITPDTDVLDLGSGWGAVACALAPNCRSVTTVDTNPYNLRFIQLRAAQSGLTNLRAVRSDPLDDARLPLLDSSVDVVIMNGVLEYVGSVVRDLPVKEIQRRCLAEVKRVLKPDGVLYVGIENRFSHRYFRGIPDHSSIRYTSLLPRGIADFVTRLRSGKPYRTYTYSYHGYRSLLESAGFHCPELFLAYPSYREPKFILPGNNNHAIAYFLLRHAAYVRRKSLRRLLQTAFTRLPIAVSGSAVRNLFDSYLLVAEAGK